MICFRLVTIYRPLLLLSCLLISICSCRQNNKSESVEDVGKPEWYSNAIIYNLDVDAFKDSDGDGTGDFKGLTQKLGYLDSLGVDVIWLSPFQPTPDQDDGYDVSDYYGIDSRLGTKADFEEFMQTAKSRGFRVIMDMVLNHTSTENAWFKAARADTNSKYFNWYVWADKKPKDANEGMVFPGVQTETWTYDDATDKYYFHRFYDFQPDLNYEHEDVRKMAKDVLTYWLKQGMDGFRLDAVPFIIDKPKTGSKNPQQMPEILTDITATLRKVRPDVVLLGEANVTPEENSTYFGKDASRLQMMFSFYTNQYLFYALANNDPQAYAKSLEEFRSKPASAQWVFFLRNHDEIDLGRLSKSQRNLVYEKMGPEANMQLYDRGIRRRLAPMLDNMAKIKMSYSLLFSAPGTQLIRYGEEIGMGDDLTLRERMSVRTPMQWDTTANAGFSSARKTFRPVIGFGKYDYKDVNVENEWEEQGSLLNHIRQLITLRKAHPEIGLGSWKLLDSSSGILLMRYDYKGKTMLAAHNFSDKAQVLELDEVLTNGKSPQILYQSLNNSDKNNDNKYELPAFGYMWLSL